MAFLAPIAVPLAVAAGVIGAFGSIMGGIAAGQAGKANQKQANQAASLRRQQAALQYQQTRLEGDRFKGEQMAAIAGAGVDVGLGSPLELVAETAREVEWRALMQRWEGENEAIGLENRGRLAKWEGNIRKTTAFAQAAGQLFGAASAPFLGRVPGATATATGGHEMAHEVA